MISRLLLAAIRWKMDHDHPFIDRVYRLLRHRTEEDIRAAEQLKVRLSWYVAKREREQAEREQAQAENESKAQRV